jgi:predicted molibdopterin-dependent oxidoreductase YjgC
VLQRAQPTAVGAIASPHATNEELFLFQRWVRQVIGTPHLDHRVELEAPTPALADFELSLDDLSACDVVFILGDQPALDTAPILELRLKKARRQGHTKLVLARDRPPSALLEETPDNCKEAGIVTLERLAGDATVLQSRLQERGIATRRLTILPAANSRGAADLGCVPELLPGYVERPGRPAMGTWEMLEAAAEGRLKALIIQGPSPLAELRDNALLERALGQLELLVVLDIAQTQLSERAHVALPMRSFAEKEGTYTNLEGRVQRLRPAVPPIAQAPPDWRVLQDLANAWEAGWAYTQVSDVMRDIIAAVPAYAVAKAGDRANWGEGAVA